MRCSSLVITTVVILITTEMSQSYHRYTYNGPNGYRFRRRSRFKRVPAPFTLRRDLVSYWPSDQVYEAMRANIFMQSMNYLTQQFENSLPGWIDEEMQKNRGGGMSSGRDFPDRRKGPWGNQNRVPFGRQSGHDYADRSDEGISSSMNQQSNIENTQDEMSNVPDGQEKSRQTSESVYDKAEEEEQDTETRGSQPGAYEYNNEDSGNGQEDIQVHNILSPPESSKSLAVVRRQPISTLLLPISVALLLLV